MHFASRLQPQLRHHAFRALASVFSLHCVLDPLLHALLFAQSRLVLLSLSTREPLLQLREGPFDPDVSLCHLMLPLPDKLFAQRQCPLQLLDTLFAPTERMLAFGDELFAHGERICLARCSRGLVVYHVTQLGDLLLGCFQQHLQLRLPSESALR